MEKMKRPTLQILKIQLEEIQRAYQSFYIAIDEFKNNQSDFIRDSILQRFEYCLEGSRKMGRNILLYGLVPSDDLLSAGQCLRQMHTHKLISDIGLWIDLVEARNALSHVYSEDKSIEIFYFIQKHNAIFKDIEKIFISRTESQHD